MATRWIRGRVFSVPAWSTVLLFVLLDARVLVAAQQRREKIPVSLSGTQGYGDDGDWSGVTISVGTPKQVLDVWVSTSSRDLWVLTEDLCPEQSLPLCSKRGRAYFPERSSTWRREGQKAVDTRTELLGDGEGTPTALFGTDVVLLGNNEQPLGDWSVGILNSTETSFMGVIGIASKKGDENSITGRLAKNYVIQSSSWSYTAGALYKTKKVPSLLVLGGYDPQRLFANDAIFKLSPDGEPIAYMTSAELIATGSPPWGPEPYQLLLAPLEIMIDSGTPYLWLPTYVCRELETAMGIRYDPIRNLYFYGSEKQQEILRGVNFSIKFRFSTPGVDDSNFAEINLSRDALNLKMPRGNSTDLEDEPGDSTSVYYLPIRRAASDDQLTLGRVFLQDSVLVTHYDANVFAIYQANFDYDITAGSKLVSLDPSGITIESNSNGSGSSGLSRPTIIGISVGIAVLGICALIAIFSRLHRSRKKKKAAKDLLSNHELQQQRYNRLHGDSTNVSPFPPSPYSPSPSKPPGTETDLSMSRLQSNNTSYFTNSHGTPHQYPRTQQSPPAAPPAPQEVVGDMVQMEPQELEGDMFVGQPSGGRNRLNDKVLLTDEAVRWREGDRSGGQG